MFYIFKLFQFIKAFFKILQMYSNHQSDLPAQKKILPTARVQARFGNYHKRKASACKSTILGPQKIRRRDSKSPKIHHDTLTSRRSHSHSTDNSSTDDDARMGVGANLNGGLDDDEETRSHSKYRPRRMTD